MHALEELQMVRPRPAASGPPRCLDLRINTYNIHQGGLEQVDVHQGDLEQLDLHQDDVVGWNQPGDQPVQGHPGGDQLV